MSTYTQILYQLVFSTKYRNPTLLKEHRRDLYGYIYGILKNKNCFVYQIGGVEDHIHIVFELHPSVALSDLVKDIKLGAIGYIKEQAIFPDFKGWQDGYGAFTYSAEAQKNLIAYVKNQEIHHQKQSSLEEIKQLLEEFEIPYDDKYLV
jgi:REP element-mobilizing transposase RayT